MPGWDAGARARWMRALRPLGWPGAAGAALGVVTIAVAAFGLPRLQRDVDGLRAAADAVRAQAWHRAQLIQTSDRSLNPQQAFVASFPPSGTRVARLQALLALTERHDLKLRQSEYRYVADAALGIGRYRLNLPVEASYQSVQTFVADALKRDQALSLDGLVLQRDRADDLRLRAELSLTLYTRGDAPLRAATAKGLP